MADVIGELIYKITGDSTQLKGSLKDTESAAGKTGGVFSGLKGTIAAALSTAAVVAFGKSLLDAASDAQETKQKFEVVFGTIQQEAKQTAADIAANYNVSRTESQALLASTGDLLTGLGFSQKAALNMSEQVVKLGADLTSFQNYSGGAAGASEVLTKALLGEFDALAGLGIKLGESDFKEYAESVGKTTGELTRMEKAQVVLQKIQEQSKNATGDVARSTDTYAFNLRAASVNVDNLQATLGANLLPVATIALKAFNSMASSLDENAQKFNDFATSTEGSKIIGDVIGNIAGALSSIGVIAGPVIDALGDGFDEITDIMFSAADGSVELVDSMNLLSILSVAVSNGIRLFATVLTGVITIGIDTAKVIWEMAKSVSYFIGLLTGQVTWSQFKTQISETGQSIIDLGTNTINSADKVIKEISRQYKSTAGDIQKTSTDAINAFNNTSNEISKTATNAFRHQKKSADGAADSTIQLANANTEIIDQVKSWDKDIITLFSHYEELFEYVKSEDPKLHAAAEQTLMKTFQLATGMIQGVQDIISETANLMQVLNEEQMIMLEDQYNANIALIDEQERRALEAIGYVENTRLASLEEQLAAAIEAEDTEKAKKIQNEIDAELIKEEHRKKRIDAENTYNASKADYEYKAAHQAWEFQLAMSIASGAIAVLNAISSGFSTGGPVGAAIFGGLAGVVAGIQIAAVAAQEPTFKAPLSIPYQFGGIVPGSSYTGDNIPASVNSGEMILTREQQTKLFEIANQGGGEKMIDLTVILDGIKFYKKLYEDSKSGKFVFDMRGLVQT